ncbi:MAG TPA: adenosylcobinamide-GDP ribazoletransferase [Acidobacteriaceae bacterium]|jgi:adenosylcobinamide-GDP ribazoletransferase
MKNLLRSFVLAFQLLTRIPMPAVTYTPEAMAGSAAFFPLVGLVVGACAVLVRFALKPHLPAALVAIAVLLATILLTGALHEDGLADAADAFGAGGSREHMLQILKDSRIGSYGALALLFSVGVRCLLLLAMPDDRFVAYVVCAHVLCRWTAAPLAFALPPAREGAGQGSQLAGKTSLTSLLVSNIFAAAIAVYLLRAHCIAPLLAMLVVTGLSGWYYRRRLGGITGDCFGATNQLTEIAIYLCGVVH